MFEVPLLILVDRNIELGTTNNSPLVQSQMFLAR